MQANTVRGETLDAAFDALAARRRRYVLYHLLEVSGDDPDDFSSAGEVAVTELAGLIAAMEAGRPPNMIQGGLRQRIALELSRLHLPKLADGGLVTYDEEREVARLTEDAVEFAPYLDLASEDERPPPEAAAE